MAESHGCRDADGNGQPNATATSPGQISPTPALIPARFLSRAVRRLRRRHRKRGWRPRLALFPVASRSGATAL